MKKDDFNKYLAAFMDMDEKKIYGVFAVILLLFFLLDYFVIMHPQLNALSTINAEIEVERQGIDKINKNIKNLAEYQKKVTGLQSDLKEMNSLVKSIDEIPLILEQISNIADKNGIKLDQINPNSQEKALILENNNISYFAFPILIEGRAKYHDFGKFLNGLENSNVCLKIVYLSISSVERSSYHTVALTIDAIVFKKTESKEE